MSWQTPADDIMEMILQRIEISDRIRIGAVCKSWGSIANREEIRRAPQFPWLVCPDGDCGESLNFSSRLEEKCYQLKLPSPVQGSWFCASSKGWLVMVKEDGLNSRMYLLNPISTALHELPLLKTVPSFEKFVETENWKQVGALFFCFKVVLSSSDVGSGSCVVAALFRDSYSRKMLGLCRPGDATWSVFPVLDDYEDHHLADILFCSGMLYALVAKRIRNCEKGNVVTGGTLELGDDCAVELKLVYDKSEKRGGFNPEDTLLSKGLCYSHLLQSTTDDEVLVVHQMQDLYDGGGGGGGGNIGNEAYDDDDGGGHNVEGNEAYDDGDDHGGGHNVEGNDDQDAGEVSLDECIYKFDEEPLIGTKVWTTEFRVYKLDKKNGHFLRVNRLEDELLFLANNGCLSVPQKDFSSFQGNCILFATNNRAYGVSSVSPDNGTFYLDNGEIEPKSRNQRFWNDNNNDKDCVLSDEESGNDMNPSATVYMSIRSRFSWFIPSLW